MARQLRIEYAGAIHHVTSRGNDKQTVFRSDVDRRMFLALLGEAVQRFGWSVSAWVLMTNHFHLVIMTPQPNLSQGMHWLNGKYASWFNRTHKRSGHLFQGRFHNVLIQKESHFARVIRYVALNPVRGKIVRNPEKYRWSSFRATAGLEKAPAWFDLAAALEPFSGAVNMVAAYRSFVETDMHGGGRLWDEVTNSIYLGTESWTREMRAQVESKPRSSDFPLTQRAVGRPKMAEIVNAVARAANVSREILQSRHGGELRRLAAWIGWHEGWLTLRSIAAALRLRSEGYITSLIRRCGGDLGKNSTLLATLDTAVAALRA
jgi:REP element-mobilizing transposase RayT